MSKKGNKKLKKPAPVPLFVVRINVFNNGDINVTGFPSSLDMALDTMDRAKNAIVKYFLQQAKKNRLNDQNVVDGGNIIVPKKGLVKLN